MARSHNATGRSRRQLSSFVALERYMLRSPAWKSLSLPARCAFIELGNLYNGLNNGRIALSARSLANLLPISRVTASRALSELANRGFIEAVRKGGFNMKTGETKEYDLDDEVSEFPMVNGRHNGRAYRYSYNATMVPGIWLLDGLKKYDLKTGECAADRRLRLRKYNVVRRGDEIFVTI